MHTRIGARNARRCIRLLIGISPACFALLAGTGCTPDVSDLRSEGVSQFRSRQYIESMATMREVLEQAPNDAQANYYMGLNYRTVAARKFAEGDVVAARRELDTAVVYFTQAIKTWPNYMAAVSAKTEALQLRGKYDEAVATAETVASNNRGIAEHYVFLGNEYRDRGDYDNALRAYKLALASKSDHAAAYEAMSKLYERIGDTALASDAMRRASQLGASGETGMASPQMQPTITPQATGR
jgi:tetratricopeptide (TPR) repeat protein